MGRVGENNQAPNSGNEFNDGSHQNQARSTLHPQHQQGTAPYQENDDYDQPAAFPPPPDKAHAFPPPQADQQTAASFPPPQFHEQPMPAFHQQAGFNGGNMHGGMQGNNMGGNPMHGGSPFNNPTFQPMPMPMPVHQTPIGMANIGFNNEQWKTNLFDCCEDPENAVITACFPCVTFGQIAEIVDQGQSSCGSSGCLYTLIACCIAMPCLLSCTYRTKLRNRFRLVEADGPDWLIHCCCEWCALCQEYRELKQRGYDPAIGWAGNAAKMRMANGVAMTPPVQPVMMGR